MAIKKCRIGSPAVNPFTARRPLVSFAYTTREAAAAAAEEVRAVVENAVEVRPHAQ
jgi:hypothetical protein